MQQVRNVNAHFSNLPQNKNIGEKKISSPLSHKKTQQWLRFGRCAALVSFQTKFFYLKKKNK